MCFLSGQKAPSAKRCIKTACFPSFSGPCGSQKAPSAKRCIKTAILRNTVRYSSHVRKHRAPKGALRRRVGAVDEGHVVGVRKHRAPKGALRQQHPTDTQAGLEERQKAPSAKRCIKTESGHVLSRGIVGGSESTERQKVGGVNGW